MLTRQTNVRKRSFILGRLLSLGRQSWKSRVKLDREISENRFGLMLTRQSDVRKEVLF